MFPVKKLVIPFLLMLLGNLKAQDTTNYSGDFAPPAKPVSIYALKATGNIVLDGRLTEADWAKAESIIRFVQVEPYQGEKPKYLTTVKILFDNKYIYVGAYCKDTTGKKNIRVQDFRRDFEYFENDLFGVAFDPFNKKETLPPFKQTLMVH